MRRRIGEEEGGWTAAATAIIALPWRREGRSPRWRCTWVWCSCCAFEGEKKTTKSYVILLYSVVYTGNKCCTNKRPSLCFFSSSEREGSRRQTNERNKHAKLARKIVLLVCFIVWVMIKIKNHTNQALSLVKAVIMKK